MIEVRSISVNRSKIHGHRSPDRDKQQQQDEYLFQDLDDLFFRDTLEAGGDAPTQEVLTEYQDNVGEPELDIKKQVDDQAGKEGRHERGRGYLEAFTSPDGADHGHED